MTTECAMWIRDERCTGTAIYRVEISNGTRHHLCPDCTAAARKHRVEIERIELVRP